MPSPKNDIPATNEPEHGFAALEAKVEELQQEAVQGMERVTDDAASTASLMLERAQAFDDPTPPPEFPGSDAAALLKTSLGALTAYTQDALRLQTEALASLGRVRSPQDFLAAQMDYGRQALELYMSSIARWTQAVPAYAPARQPAG